MQEILLNGITADELKTDILNGIDKLIKDNLRQKAEQTKYLTRKETAELLKVDKSTLHNWQKQGILIPKQIGRRVYYSLSDIKDAML
jgi:hypothetical protein